MHILKMKLSILFILAFVSVNAYWLPEDQDSGLVKTCTVPKSNGDDSPEIMSTVANCGNNSRVVFSAGVTYNLDTPIQFSNLNNVEFVFNGNLTLPDNVTAVEAVVGNSELYPGHWITVSSGTGVTFTGSKDNSGGWFMGHGDLWWSNSNDSNNDNRPHFFSFGVTSLRLRDLKILKPVAWVFSLGGEDVYMTNTLLDAKSDDGFAFNTDGIDCSASNVVIDGWTSWNGDDVINVAPPSVNVTMRNVVAHGTHGLSVSCSSGTGGDYLFENAIIYDSLIGARFKGVLGTTCNMYNITWRNLVIVNVSYPIHFIENYVDQEVGPPPGANLSLAAYATGFTWESIVGVTSPSLQDGSCISDPCWSYTAGQSPEKSLYILCKDSDHCTDFHFSSLNLVGADGEPGQMDCTGLEGVTGMGLTCTNGTVVLT